VDDLSVSIIIPTYNRSALVGRAIRSALAAASPGDEILVIDDGSSDDTAEVLRPFGDAIRCYRIENSGPGAARNVGIRMARHPLVAFLDSDDEWMPDKLELQRKVMQEFPEAVLCFSNVMSMRPDGRVGHDQLSLWRDDIRVGSDRAPAHLSGYLGKGVAYSSFASLPEGRADFNVHVGDMYFPQMEVLYVYGGSVVVRRELAGALLHFPEDVRLMEDWECWANISKLGPSAYLDCELAIQHVHSGSRLTTDVDDIKQVSGRIRVLRRIWGSDPGFLRAHSARYNELLRSQRIYRAKLLMLAGRLKEARADLKEVGGPLAYRLIASLPPMLVSGLFEMKRKLRGSRVGAG
jgi:glycosyltransferase involved in cell wall biosynthesis